MKKKGCFHRFFSGILILIISLSGSWTAVSSEAQEDSSLFIVDDSVENYTRAEDLVCSLTLHEKVCQLFFVQPEQFSRMSRVSTPDKTYYRAFSRFPVGGIILFAPNIRKKELAALNAGMQAAAQEANGIGLFIGTDEEGGGVSRVANKLKLPEKQPAPAQTATAEGAYESARIIGGYLSQYGFNVDFAPVADIRTDSGDSEITVRSYGSDPDTVSEKVVRFVEGLHDCGIIPVLKHFPGHGAVSGNTHTGSGISQRTLEDWRTVEFRPFSAGIRADAEMVMISHQLAVRIDPDSPASLSPVVISLLRDELGFQGVIITDALRMGAVYDNYGSGEACVRALEAGADMLLLPYNFTNAYQGIMKAVRDGRLTEKRINESVLRILTLKEKYGLLPPHR